MKRLLWAALTLPLLLPGSEPESEEIRSVHEALARSDIKAAIELLPFEQDIEARNQAGDTLLCAALLGYENPTTHRIVREILDRGADPNAECSNLGTPLNFAIITEAYAAIDLLLERGADVNGRNSELGSLKPVAYAYMMGHLDVAGYLESRGGTVSEGVRVEALKTQAQMDYYVTKGQEIPSGLSPLEHSHYMWEIKLQAILAATEHETNVHLVRLERLWVKKAMAMKYDPGSGMSEADWTEWAMDKSFEEAYQELKASGAWREDELPGDRLFGR